MDLMMSPAEGSETPQEHRLHITGKATVMGAGELKRLLAEALAAADALTLDVSGVTESDLSLYQLLCAAHQSSALLGKRLTIAPAGYHTFMQRAAAAGFLPAAAGCRHHINCPLQEENI